MLGDFKPTSPPMSSSTGLGHQASSRCWSLGVLARVGLCLCPSHGLCQNLACLCVCLSPSPHSSPSSHCIWLHLAQRLALLPVFQRSLVEFLLVSHSCCVCVSGGTFHSFSLSGVCRVSLCVCHRACLCVSCVYLPVGHVSPRPGLGWLPPTATLADTPSVCPPILPPTACISSE